MAEALSDGTIDIVKATVPTLENVHTAVTDRMYQLLFRNQQVRNLFNQSHQSRSGETGAQSKALTAALIAYARNINNLGALASRVERIIHKLWL